MCHHSFFWKNLKSWKKCWKVKHGVHGEVERYKAWGFTQTFGVNYNKTFARIAKFMSICCILVLVTIENMKIHQIDNKISFLNGDLEEEIYMEQPQGFTEGNEHLVCKLHKSLYGLKQFPRAWNKFQMHFWKLSNLWGMMWTLACMLHKWKMSSFSLLSVSMISSWCAIIRTSFCKWRKNFLESSKWKILMICIFSWAWKWKKDRDWCLLYINQIGYFKEILKHFHIEDYKNIKVPLNPKAKLKNIYEPKCWNGEGSLSTSRWILDICHVYLARFGIPNKRGLHMANLSLKHWIVIKHIFRYLQGIL